MRPVLKIAEVVILSRVVMNHVVTLAKAVVHLAATLVRLAALKIAPHVALKTVPYHVDRVRHLRQVAHRLINQHVLLVSRLVVALMRRSALPSHAWRVN
jgi:hypothetical protein